MQCLSASHAFDYIALRICPGLTSYKELATVMDTNLDNNSSCNASYILPYRCMFGITNLLLPYRYTCYTYIYKVCIKSKQTSIKNKNFEFKKE